MANYSNIKGVNEQYLARLYETHYMLCVNYANQFLRDMELAKEMAQEAFVALWLKRESLDSNNNVEYYLLATVRNNVFNHLRKKQRIANKMGTQMPVNDRLSLIAIEDDVSERLLHNELRRELNKALKKIPQIFSETFVLSREFRLSYKEIAAKQGISVKTVEYRMSKALQIIKNELAEFLPIIFWTIINLFVR